MGKYLEFINPFDRASGNVFVRAEHLARYHFAAEFIGRRKLPRVLDAACGDGYGSGLLARRAEAVEGVDGNNALIEKGNARLAAEGIQNVRLRAADLNERLGCFEDGAFDCVACFETLEHVKKDGSLLLEFRRVMRRGGALLLSVPKEGYEKLGAGGNPENPFHLRLYSETGLRGLLEGCGFRVEKTLGQPYSNAARVRMEDFRRDRLLAQEETAGYFQDTPEALEFYAKVFGWPTEECPDESSVLISVCR